MTPGTPYGRTQPQAKSRTPPTRTALRTPPRTSPGRVQRTGARVRNADHQMNHGRQHPNASPTTARHPPQHGPHAPHARPNQRPHRRSPGASRPEGPGDPPTRTDTLREHIRRAAPRHALGVRTRHPCEARTRSHTSRNAPAETHRALAHARKERAHEEGAHEARRGLGGQSGNAKSAGDPDGVSGAHGTGAAARPCLCQRP